MLRGLKSLTFHIGSTAIPGRPAKAVINILLAIESLKLLDAYVYLLQSHGCLAHGEFGIPGHRFYTKGRGKMSHHIHAFEFKFSTNRPSSQIRRFLRESSKDAEAYAVLKLRLSKEFKYFRTDLAKPGVKASAIPGVNSWMEFAKLRLDISNLYAEYSGTG